MHERKIRIMVSSTVYGVEELLDRVYALLTGFGYEVWMSHKGTVPVFSNQTAFQSCLSAVEKCDLFLGIITSQYGSGVGDSGVSITHQEIRQAVALKKPRWFLAHEQVVFARRLLADLGYRKQQDRQRLALKARSASLSDLKIIDMYEEATMEQLPLNDRQGNWVQKFVQDDEANLFVVAQFSRYQDVEQRLIEHFTDSRRLAKSLGGSDE